MGFYVDRDGTGKITDRYAIAQRDGQEYLEDDAPEILALAFEEVRRVKVATINAAFDTAIAAGFPYGGKVIDLDDTSRANISAIATRAMAVVLGIAGMGWPDGFAWRTKDNTTLALSPEQMLDMAQDGANRFTALIFVRGAKKDAAAAATSAEDLDAIDAAAGWD